MTIPTQHLVTQVILTSRCSVSTEMSSGKTQLFGRRRTRGGARVCRERPGGEVFDESWRIGLTGRRKKGLCVGHTEANSERNSHSPPSKLSHVMSQRFRASASQAKPGVFVFFEDGRHRARWDAFPTRQGHTVASDILDFPFRHLKSTTEKGRGKMRVAVFGEIVSSADKRRSLRQTSSITAWLFRASRWSPSACSFFCSLSSSTMRFLTSLNSGIVGGWRS